MSQHTIEYSRSSRAKCHGPNPCKGSSIDSGMLRYGRTIHTPYGESVQWRHWGCVTPQILDQLAAVGLPRVAGFQYLRSEDQQKVRAALINRRIDPSDVPATANPIPMALAVAPAVPDPTPPRSKKRKSLKAGSSIQSSSSSVLIDPRQQLGETEQMEDDNGEEEGIDELYCTLSTSVVGIQYYNGLVGAGEQVSLVREPQNRYDSNAIQVKNIANMQVGHLSRQVVSRLAPLLDQNLVTAEGIMLDGNLRGKRGYSLSMMLRIFGASDRRARLEPLLTWATPGQRGFAARGDSGPASGSSMIIGPSSSKAQQKATRQQQLALQKAFDLKQMLSGLEQDDILNLPLHPNPPGVTDGLLNVDLLKHQSQALQWCIEHEHPALPKTESDKPVQFWQLRKSDNKAYYYNIATKTPQETPPVLGRGAVCADSMGLGKTLTMLALVIATKDDVPDCFSNSTLIVAPLSVLYHWEQQIQEHCRPGTISHCIYHGTNRSMSTQALQRFDVVITTYQTVAGEHEVSGGVAGQKKKKKMDNSLFHVQWKRIVLDEGHYIRNAETKMAKAVRALDAERRWVLSGTPIINSPRDLGSLLAFLRTCRPLDNEDFFKRLLLRPLKDGYPEGAELLRALMSQICIRRTKEMQDSNGDHLVPLPPVTMTVVPVTLHPETRAEYDSIEEISKQRLEKFMSRTGGFDATVQSNVLSMLTRLRQLALHPALIPSNYVEQLQALGENMNQPAVHLTPEDRVRLQSALAQFIEDNEECPICFCLLVDPRITSCAHPFCLVCITEAIARDPRCPMDRRPIGIKDLIEPAPATESTQDSPPRFEEESGARSGSSAKIDQLVHLLQLTPAMEKSLVFSQFTTFLDKIEEALEENGIPYVRFDGKMSAKKRQEALERFSRPLEEEVSSVSSNRTSIRKRRKLSEDCVESVDADENDLHSPNAEADSSFDEDDNPWSRMAKSRAKGKGKAIAWKQTDSEENPKVMLLSLKAGSLGLNLTVANNVYLMDPWWQEGIESQAIDRCNRIGQKKPVHVYQMIAENTVESKVIAIQERKKALIQQAFSGIKRTETPREKREARLQDLVELFGLRREEASQRS